MSLIGLLASMENTVPEGHLHMRPLFQFHLKEHWIYPQSLHSLLPWTESFSPHLEWWQVSQCDERFSPLSQDQKIELLTDASDKGWGSHLEQTSSRVCGQTGKKGYT